MKHSPKRMTRTAARRPERPPARAAEQHPSLTLGVVVAVEAGRALVRSGTLERRCAVDPSVDPALLAEAARTGARVVGALAEPPVVVGALSTHRTLAIDAAGGVDVALERFRVTAPDLQLRSTGAFVRVAGEQVELYGTRVVGRARELVKLLGRMVKLN